MAYLDFTKIDNFGSPRERGSWWYAIIAWTISPHIEEARYTIAARRVFFCEKAVLTIIIGEVALERFSKD